MTHHFLPITYDNIEAIAAAAFAKSRDCITAIRMDVLHNIQPLERVGFERLIKTCLLYTSPSPRDRQKSRMPSSA